MRKRIPYILNADGALKINTSFFKKLVKTFYVKRSRLCFAGCERAELYFKTYGAKPEKIVRHPFTSLSEKDIPDAPPTKEEKLAAKADIGIADSKAFLAVGQFIHRKGYDLLLDAWSKTGQNAHLFIIGGGPLLEEYTARVEREGLKNVHIFGYMTTSELKKYYLAADAFVMPTREDIWGLVVNEALANALPVISSDSCNAGRELIRSGVSGYLYPTLDSEALAEKLEALLSSDEKRARMSKTALEAVKNHSYENVAKAHIEALKKILNN